MLELLVFLLTMLCTNPKPHQPDRSCNGIHLYTNNADDGGETGDIPPPPPPPPPVPRS